MILGPPPDDVHVSIVPVSRPLDRARPPFFFIAPAMKQLQQLSGRHVPGPLYGALPVSFNGVTSPPRDAEDLGRIYADAITAKQPTGPYLLGGYCTAGLIAIEVAQQLIAAGHRVELLVLVSTIEPSMLPDDPASISMMSALLGWEYPSPLNHPEVQHALEVVLPVRRSGEITLAQMIEQLMPAIRSSLEAQMSRARSDMVLGLYEAWLWSALLAWTYRYRPYPGRITYVYNPLGLTSDGFAARESQLSEERWRQIARGGFDCLPLAVPDSGDSTGSMLLAPEFRAYLRNAL